MAASSVAAAVPSGNSSNNDDEGAAADTSSPSSIAEEPVQHRCRCLPASLSHPPTRLATGVACLVGVVLIWVLSSELTRFIFVKEQFNKPFFTTYFKTGLFTLYLSGFFCLPSWRQLCVQQHQRRSSTRRHRRGHGGYTRVGDSETQSLSSSSSSSSGDDSSDGAGVSEDATSASRPTDSIRGSVNSNNHAAPLLSDPRFVPVNFDSSSDADSVASLSINSDVESVRPERGDDALALTELRASDVTANQSLYYDDVRGENAPLIGPSGASQSSSSLLSAELLSDGQQPSRLPARRQCRGVRFSRLSEVRQLSESQALAANMARLSYSAYLRARENAGTNGGYLGRRVERLTVMQVAKLALLFCLVWFLGNWSYQEALNCSPAGVVNVISTSSSLFTLILSAVFPSEARDRFSLSKLLAVMLCSGGVVLISWSDLEMFHSHSRVPWGAIFALLGSFCYAVYLVLLKRKARSEAALSFPMFFGFVGLFNALMLWPGFFIVHYARIEPFQLPNSTDWGYITLNGLVGTTLSELLWLWGCFLSTSLLATLSLSLTIPLTMVADFLLDNVEYDWRFYCGSIPVFLAFVIVAFLCNSDDPDYDPAMTFLISCRDLLLTSATAGDTMPSASAAARRVGSPAAVSKRRSARQLQQQQQQQQIQNSIADNPPITETSSRAVTS